MSNSKCNGAAVVLPRVCVLLVIMAAAWPQEINADIVQVDDLNIIDDAANPSDELRYLDMTFSDGLTKLAALSAAQVKYSNARLASADEWDDLFAAAGISYDGALTASSAFSSGSSGSETISSGVNYDAGALSAVLGATASLGTVMFSDPDKSNDAATTRDYLYLTQNAALIFNSTADAPNPSSGWLIVSESTAATVPEPSSVFLTGLGAAGFFAYGSRRKRKRPNAPL